ncbi:MAG: cytochrome c oxidase assembly factor Coa1 family protein, partial [Christiangramia sp.]
AQAYLDDELYTKAIEKANRDQRIEKKLGEIQPIDKMAILNGEVRYSDDNQSVISTIKIKGEKANGKLDLRAHRKEEKWKYDQLNIRILNPNGNNETLKIIASEK